MKDEVTSGPSPGSPGEVLRIFLRLGTTSFGGPVAHLAYFRRELVEKRRWLDETAYADTVALCQLLPGPSSSQVAVCLGISRAGLAGGLAAWSGFCLPSALIMILFADAVDSAAKLGQGAWLHGLKIAAVAVVAQAVWAMYVPLCPDRSRKAMALFSAVLCLAVPTAAGQVLAMFASALLGWRWVAAEPVASSHGRSLSLPRGAVPVALLLLLGLLALSLRPWTGPVSVGWGMLAAFYRSGMMVFGGGHVVLPLLQQAVCAPGWISADRFLAGYGAAQAMPGPLFSLAAYLGACSGSFPSAWWGGLTCLCAIYLPTFLLLLIVLPHWDQLRRRSAIQSALKGINAGVVGLLLAALYSPVWTGAIFTWVDFGQFLLAFVGLTYARLPAWLVVVAAAALADLVEGH